MTRHRIHRIRPGVYQIAATGYQGLAQRVWRILVSHTRSRPPTAMAPTLASRGEGKELVAATVTEHGDLIPTINLAALRKVRLEGAP